LALACLAPGLVAFSLTNVLARAFFALGDTTTPMKISVACLMLNLVLALWLIVPMRQAGLGLANTCTAVLNVTLLLYALRRKLARLELSGFVRSIPGLLVATAVSGVAAWAIRQWWKAGIGHEVLATRLGEVFVPATLSAVLYWAVASWFRVPAVHEVTSLLLNKLRRRSS
jgi:putative peptidoglycan lipid II flippase